MGQKLQPVWQPECAGLIYLAKRGSAVKEGERAASGRLSRNDAARRIRCNLHFLLRYQ